VEASSPTRKALRGTLLSLIALMTFALNWDTFLVNDVLITTRAGITAALLVGLVGTWQKNRVVRIATAFVAWAGFALYFLFVVVTIIPGEGTRAAGYAPDQSLPLLLERFGLLIMVGVGSAFAYFKLLRAVRDS
jgi:hypothetical protein